MRTRMLVGLTTTQLTVGAVLAAAGLYDVDNPTLSRLGLLIMLCSIPAWNATMVRCALLRAQLVAADQLNDTFEAGYQLCAAHVAHSAYDTEPGDVGKAVPRGVIPHPLDPTERHDR